MTQEQLISTPAEKELSESFLEYSMSVVYARAIPGIDGFKPVQRRILYGMQDSGWTHDKNFVKVSRIAGQVMGLYHPHGDTSISDALVKLGQPFYTNVPLLSSYGNWGDVSGSSPAAARYIEGKLSKAAEYALREIKEDTVDMKPNYDGTTEEPVLLPVMFPTLLVNGMFGIGVGFSNNIPSHNLREVIDGTKALIRKPNSDLDAIMQHIPGPDFPTGAEIIGTDGIREAYETGRGIIRIRSKVEIKPTSRGKHELIFTELPFGVKTVKIIDKIKELLKVGKLSGLADAKDLTDRKNGLRIVIDVKAGVNPRSVLAELYRETDLEDSFGINSTVLVNGEPKAIGLVEMLQLFIDFRKDVVRRRSEFRKQKRADRLHIVEGLLKALANIDAVIKIVRAAADSSVAQDQIMTRFKVDQIQADYILSIPLRRLTRYDTLQLEEEKVRLEQEISQINEILSDETALKNVILKELDEIKKDLGTDRKSTISGVLLTEHIQEAKNVASAIDMEVEDAPCIITVYASGALTRTAEPVTVAGRGKIDPIVGVIDTTVRGNFVVGTNKGNGYRIQALHVSDSGKSSAKDVGLTLKSGERIVVVGRNATNEGEAGLALGTKQGVVKISNTDFPLRSDEFPLISLADGDEVIGGGWVSDPANTDFAFLSTDTSLLRFEAAKVRPQGSKGGGMAGIKLATDAHALVFAVVPNATEESAEFVTYTGKTIKRSAFAEVPKKGRATGGVRAHALRKGEERLEAGGIGSNLLVLDAANKAITLPGLVKRDGSGTPTEGVTLIGLRA